jgi:hypothetical protein
MGTSAAKRCDARLAVVLAIDINPLCTTAKLRFDVRDGIFVASMRSRPSRHVRYASNSDRIHARNKPSRCANSIINAVQQPAFYSISSSWHIANSFS